MITITESDMNFGPFENDVVIHIEKSELYKRIGEGVKISEFIYKEKENLIFVEAKSSSPRQLKVSIEINKSDNEEIVEYPSQFILDVSSKLTNTLDMFMSVNLKIINDNRNEVINFLDFKNISNYQIKFYLVINGHDKEWLPPIQDALQKNLLSQSKIWNLDVKVMNDAIAKKYRLMS